MTTRVGWIPCIGPPPPPGTPTYLPKRRQPSSGEGQGTGKLSSNEEYSETTDEKLSFKIPNVGPQEMVFKEPSKTPLKLVMDPRGQVQDLASLRQQGYNIETGALSPDICLDLVRDLNATKGKGAELFAKRRKKSEKWVVDETTVKKSSTSSTVTDYISSSSTLQRQSSIGTPSQLPPIVPSYLDTSRVQHAQKLNEIQERFTLPRLRLVKSPWEAALETGSVDAAFQELKPLQSWSFSSAPTPAAPEPVLSSTFDSYKSTTPQPVSAEPVFTPLTPSTGVSQPPSQRVSGHEKDFLYKPKAPRGWSGAQHSQQSYVPPAPVYSYEPSIEIVQEQPPAARFSFNTLNNYNTAPRGWGQGLDYYRPVTFAPTRIG